MLAAIEATWAAALGSKPAAKAAILAGSKAGDALGEFSCQSTASCLAVAKALIHLYLEVDCSRDSYLTSLVNASRKCRKVVWSMLQSMRAGA
jgi:hypothetical protein